jgi:IclR family transcriptional regulator, KDG regulon repressor
MRSNNDNKYPVKSVVKTLTILEHLGTSPSGTSLTEISSKLRIGKSTVHRLLGTLKDHDFVWLEPHSSRYILGARILQLSQQLNNQSILIRYGEPVLTKLARATGETCNLGVLDRKSVLYLIMKESRNPLRMSGEVGKRLPVYCTALGKALLTGLNEEEINNLFGKTDAFESFTENTVANAAQLMHHVEKARTSGIARDNEEIYPGVCCLATPIRDHSGSVVAAISVSFPKNRVDTKTLQQFKSLLLESASELSRHLGYKESALAESRR